MVLVKSFIENRVNFFLSTLNLLYTFELNFKPLVFNSDYR